MSTPHPLNNAHDPDWELLARYVSGEATPAEDAAVAAWIAGDADRGRLVASLRDAWVASASPPPDSRIVDAAWQRLSAKIDGGRPLRARWPRAAAARRREVTPFRVALVAAAAVILLAVGVQLRPGATGGLPVAMPAAELTAVPGARVVSRLTDGTTVTLAPDSRMRVDARFGDASRRVELEGEALFEVAHNAEKPFVVSVASGQVEVRGTIFGVRSYAGEPEVSVAVREGAVAVRGDSDAAAGPGLVLRAGEVGVIPSAGVAVRRDDVSVATLLAWHEGRLVFDDAPLAEVALRLSRWYDLDVSVPDTSISGLRLSAAFGDEPVADVLAVVGAALGVDVVRDGRSVRFTRRPAPEVGVPGRR